MGKKSLVAADLLFAIQMLGMAAFIGGQTVRMLETVQGISPIWLGCAEVFCVINVGLAYRGWRQSPMRSTFQLFVTHAGWTVGIALLLVLLTAKAASVIWGWYDTATLVAVAVATGGLFLAGHRHNLGITDPIIRGLLAAIFRGIPHVVLAYKISLLGGNGLASIAVWAAHVTATVRIGQLALAVKDVGWNRARVGLAIAEASSELTWVLVTLVWFFR